MPFIIGTDEAGYGPNLGPLVISTSVWRVEERPSSVDLYQRLSRVVVNCPQRAGQVNGRVVLGDSKALYRSGQGLGPLERGVLAALGAMGHRPRSWRELWDAMAPTSSELETLPWHIGFELAVPIECGCDESLADCDTLRGGLAEAKIELVALRSLAIFPAQFNRLVAEEGNKGAALTRMTLRLLGEVLEPLCEERTVICDKHGGRNRYAAALQREFPEWWIDVCAEGAAESVYRFGPPDCRTEVRFRPRGDSLLPAALASMASKYLREVAMKAFNAFWRRQVDGLAATAGYPGDARRFKDQIQPAQAALGIDDAILWRSR